MLDAAARSLIGRLAAFAPRLLFGVSASTARSEELQRIAAADLYCDVGAVPRLGWRDHLPGLVVVLAATMAAGFIADRYGAPLTLMALLIGLALNFLGSDKRLEPGLAFASRSLLRWGIVLVGARVTLGDMVALGPVALLALVAIMALVIGAGIVAARRLGFDAAYGTLAGGAVAICGASAALAIAAVLGERRASQAQLTLVLVGIAAMSALAMAFYPMIAHALGFDDVEAGFFLGAAIHDVAQALGAGYSFSPEAGRIAAIVKLTRVALLAPILLLVAACFARGGQAPRAGLPWFVIGFFLFAGLNSAQLVPGAVSTAAEYGATAMLAVAVAATGILSPLSRLRHAGLRPLIVPAVATVVACLLSLAAAGWATGR